MFFEILSAIIWTILVVLYLVLYIKRTPEHLRLWYGISIIVFNVIMLTLVWLLVLNVI